MKFLVIGLGSMGKRRVRNLRALKRDEVAGVDVRADRRDEAADRYGIPVFATMEEALASFRPDAFVISTSPDRHMAIAFAALERNIPCFIEASVVDAERILELDERTRGTALLMAPSCTMRYFQGPKKVKELLAAGVIGRPVTFTYMTGQYLPDWHPWEQIQDFYVSKRETGGCREIVPFELTWLNDIFGDPQPLACVKANVGELPADIDDVYHCLLRYPRGLIGNLTVEVISRPLATRELRILGTTGELVLSADENCVRFCNTEMPEWTRFPLGGGTVETGYINPEEPYIAELRDFVTAVENGDRSIFPNSLRDDHRVLQVLLGLEELARHHEEIR